MQKYEFFSCTQFLVASSVFGCGLQLTFPTGKRFAGVDGPFIAGTRGDTETNQYQPRERACYAALRVCVCAYKRACVPLPQRVRSAALWPFGPSLICPFPRDSTQTAEPSRAAWAPPTLARLSVEKNPFTLASNCKCSPSSQDVTPSLPCCSVTFGFWHSEGFAARGHRISFEVTVVQPGFGSTHLSFLI